MTQQPPRSARQRKLDVLRRLEQEVDAWVASASPDGSGYLVPLSYLWDGQTLTLSTPESSPTSRNLQASGRVRLAVGPTRDVVLIEGYAYFRITPVLIQAWREENELKGRDLMRDGRWLA